MANVVQGRVAVPKGCEQPAQNIELQRRIVDGLRDIPDVESAALVFDYALSATFRATPFLLRGEAATLGESRPLVAVDAVSRSFLRRCA